MRRATIAATNHERSQRELCLCELPGGRPPNGSEFRGRGSNPAVAGTLDARAINEDVGVDWPRATSMFRGGEADERHVDVPKARPRRRSRSQGGRRKRERDPRGVSWLNASERADVAGSSRSRRRGGIGPEWSKIATGSPFPCNELLGGPERRRRRGKAPNFG